MMVAHLLLPLPGTAGHGGPHHPAVVSPSFHPAIPRTANPVSPRRHHPPVLETGNGASGLVAGLLHKPSCVRSASAFGCCVVVARQLTLCRFGVIPQVPPRPTNPLTQRLPDTLSGIVAPHNHCHNGVNETVIVADAVVVFVVAGVRVKGF